MTISPGADDGLVPAAFLATTEKEQDEGQVTSMGRVVLVPDAPDGLEVATYPSGFAPGGTEYYGLAAGAPNPKAGGVGNAYAMIFVNTTDPTTALVQAQIDKLAYGV